jgi:4-alpha-glucanotransferase
MKYERSSGVLLHPTSLPGKYGIGTLGKEAFRFIDFLAKSKQQYWQILPLGPTGYADSPYQCFSSHAGNPLLIDLDQLVTDKLLQVSDLAPMKDLDGGPIDYGTVIQLKYPILKKAATNFQANARLETKRDFNNFTDENSHWLKDYSLFMSLKSFFDQKPWYLWEKDVKERNAKVLEHWLDPLQEQIWFHSFLQYIFFRQWSAVKDYANQKNIRIIGDIPLYIALDSADAWAHPEIFEFDKDRNPIAVGGVPPDYFSATGQLWGNPLFRWEELKRTGYRWWIDRIKASLVLYDVIRIDHFRGFAAYWSVPYGEKTAINGQWITGPGKDLFEAIRNEFRDIPIIAEDLGVMTPDVEELRDGFGLPGMKILQFAFDSGEENDYLPHTFVKNCIVYTGTHDNDTVTGWYNKAKKEDREYVLDYMHSGGKEIHWDFVRLAFASVADLAIIPMQDLLGLGSEARMNLPGTTVNNWMWRMDHEQMSDELAKKMVHLTKLYGRVRSKKS